MADKRLVATGLLGGGVAIAALCCFTPLLVTLLAALGLAGLVTKLDYLLLPIAAVCLGLLVYGLARRGRC
jgi:mercuric ion transport protein